MTDRGEAARRAWATRRCGPRPLFDLKSSEGRVLQRAFLAARAAVVRARRFGIPVDPEWMMDARARISEQGYRCALTCIAFDVDYRTGGAGGTHLGPSPDRIEPSRGYVRGNVRWVLWAVNRAKGEMPEELFLRICRAVANNAQGL
jgi:hypothetical protein